eukprot:gnl/TRDRNA2_/TRDRNA2_162649_c0_seq1.p1 gnl/TRDRNA2_/TRDRNA2_162649_c0~~gnl/TRDRNA2_/TRDRNA2_162649_c0_seq1.p1  ORF type:complete len:133 (+),score=20.78 gnl/TRDRNA2_/TRDRNA2_162649_c0_seq1:226-624(+)
MLFGTEFLDSLSTSLTSKNGFFTACNLKSKDVAESAASKPVSIVIDGKNGSVTYKFGTIECIAEVAVLRCVPSQTCMQREDCQRMSGDKGRKELERLKHEVRQEAQVEGAGGGVAETLSNILQIAQPSVFAR